MQRLITSLILVPLVLLAIFYANPWFLGALVLITLLAAGMECWKLIPAKHIGVKAGFLFLLLFNTWFFGYFFYYWLIIGFIAWVMIISAIVTFPDTQKYWAYPGLVAGFCLLILPLFVQSLVHLYLLPQGKGLLVFLLFLIWAADVGAYFSGKRWGKHKLIPEVSPGKSWEGVLGGFGLAMLVAIAASVYFANHSFGIWLFLAGLTAISSVFGDLFISILKRRCHLKDTGAIIPGHGGILDRLDSLLIALPLFYFGITTCF